jgi:fluoride ion exporter CrcB/FEX
MYESARLADDGAGLAAIVNLAGSLTLGLLAVRFGMMLARWG